MLCSTRKEVYNAIDELNASISSLPLAVLQIRQYTRAGKTGKRFMVTNGCVSFAVNEKHLRKRMDYFFNWRQHAGSKPEKFYKTTLFQGEHMMVGLNCLEPGQTQGSHAHEGADKFYFVLSGSGTFTVGDEERQAEAGTVVAAPAGIKHSVTNSGNERLSLLVTIAPPPNK